MDRIARLALGVLATLEYGLAELSAANDRVNLRRFLKDNPTVRWHYPDGEPGN